MGSTDDSRDTLRVKSVAGLIGLLLSAVVFAGDECSPSRFPFPLLDATLDSVSDMGGLLDAPAGKYGFIRSVGEHFVHSNGVLRLNGINLTGPAVFPTHEEADGLAARFARFGLNCARLHYFDAVYSNGVGIVGRSIFAEGERPRRRLDGDCLDRLHYLVAALKRRGVYVDVNLHVARTLDERDGVAPSCFANRGANFIDPKLRAFEKEYARDLLTAKNPYTGLSLAEDPAMALVEISNENGMLALYYSDRQFEKFGEPYRSAFIGLMREYAARTGSDDRAAFVNALDRAYWVEMRDFLKGELGVSCPIVGGQLECSSPHALSELDAVDIHLYWDHPEAGAQRFQSVLDAPLPGCCIIGGADARVAGRPFLVTESNNPYPSPFGAEYQPMLHAYGAFQDWAGVFAYTWNCSTNASPSGQDYYFSYAARSDCWAHFPAVAALFLRGDVACCRRRIDVALPEGDFVARLSRDGSGARLQGAALASKGAFDETLAFVHGVGVDVSAATSAAGRWPCVTAARTCFVSDTDELTWEAGAPGTRRFMADTPGTKFLSGFTQGKRVFFADGVSLLLGETSRGWAAVSLLSRDNTGFGSDARAARLLLAATAEGANAGMETEPVPGRDCSRRLSTKGRWGSAPYLIEGVPLTLSLGADAARVRCWALDSSGRRIAPVSVSADSRGKAVIAASPAFRTLWYEIDIAATSENRPASAKVRNSNTDWMAGKVLAFMHYLPQEDERDMVDGFDTAGLARQLVEIGVDGFVFTLGQNNNFYNAPNEAYRRIAGQQAESRFSRRDLLAEIIAALKGTRLRFGLYSPCQPSFNDEAAERAFGFEPKSKETPGDWFMTDRGAEGWSKVVAEWASRYGTDVALWWFDGARPDMRFTERHGRILREALLRANPNMVMTFNWGIPDWPPDVLEDYERCCDADPTFAERVPFREFRGAERPLAMKPWLESADYTSGEVAEPFRFMPESRELEGQQYFLLTYLGHYWGEGHNRYPDDIWIRFLRPYLARGGSIAIDMAIERKNGCFKENHARQLRRIIRALRTKGDGR